MVSKDNLNPVIILTGPTASGKTQLGFEIAQKSKKTIEIISIDSILSYQYFNIGSAKPTQEELAAVPHHCLNVAHPNQMITAGDFYTQSHAAIQEIFQRNHQPLCIGGSLFYLKVLINGLWPAPKSDPVLMKQLETLSNLELHALLQAKDPQSTLHPNDRYRILRALSITQTSTLTPSTLAPTTSSPVKFEIWILDRDDLYSKITQRTESMLAKGLIEETQFLKSQFPQSWALNSIGYKQVCQYLEGQCPKGRKKMESLNDLQNEIILATWQLVKSQRKWLVQLPKHFPNTTIRSFKLDQKKDQLQLDQLLTF